MAIQNVTTKVEATGTGTKTEFSFSPVILPDGADDLEVKVGEAIKTLTTDYTVTVGRYPGTGSITFTVAPADGVTIIMRRQLIIQQTLRLGTQGAFNPHTFEHVLDKVVMMVADITANVAEGEGVSFPIALNQGGTGSAYESLSALATALGVGTSTGNVDEAAVLALINTAARATGPTGAFAAAQIPDLSADKITSDAFHVDRIPSLAAGKITSDAFHVDRIPSLAAGKITSDAFHVDRIPSLAAGKITSDAFHVDRIPSLAAGKITSDAFHVDRIPSLSAGKTTSGRFHVDRMPSDYSDLFQDVSFASNTLTFTQADDTEIEIDLSALVSTGAAQTGAQIKVLYEAEDDTNAFTDAEKTKLTSIISSAVAPPAKVTLILNKAVTATSGTASIDLLATIAPGYLLEFNLKGSVDAIGYITSDLILAQTTVYSTAPGTTAAGGLGIKVHQVGDGNFGHNSFIVWRYEDDDSKLWVRDGRSAGRSLSIIAYPLGGEDVSLTSAQIKTKYESNDDTNAFTDTYKDNIDNLLVNSHRQINASRFGFLASRNHNIASLGLGSTLYLQDIASFGTDVYVLASNGIAVDASTLTSVVKIDTETDVRTVVSYTKGWTGARATSIAMVEDYAVVGWVNPTSGNTRIATHTRSTGGAVETLTSNEGESLEFLAASSTTNQVIECRRLANGTFRARVITVATDGSLTVAAGYVDLTDLFGPVSATVRDGKLFVLQESGDVRAYSLTGFARAAASDEYYTGTGFRGISSFSASIEYIVTTQEFVRFDEVVGVHIPPPSIVLWGKNNTVRFDNERAGNVFNELAGYDGTYGLRWKSAPSETYFGGQASWFSLATGANARTAGVDTDDTSTLPDDVYFTLTPGIYNIHMYLALHGTNAQLSDSVLRLVELNRNGTDVNLAENAMGWQNRGSDSADNVGDPDVQKEIHLQTYLITSVVEGAFYVTLQYVDVSTNDKPAICYMVIERLQ